MSFFEQRESSPPQQPYNRDQPARPDNQQYRQDQAQTPAVPQQYQAQAPAAPQQQYGNQNGYQKPAGGYQGNNEGGYQKKPYTPGGGGYPQRQGGGFQGGNGGGGGFRPKSPQDQEEPYLYRPYAATGNKEMPESFKPLIQRIGRNLEKAGYMLRTGGMEGLEDVIEKSATKLELHLPFKDFDGKNSKFTYTSDFVKGIAKMFHTSFDTLKPVVQTFLAKNVRLVLGKDGKSPALFLVVWTEDGAETAAEKTFKTGNSGNAIAIANAIKIPVFNLVRPDAERRLYDFIGFNPDAPVETKPQSEGY
jgi:hypothetical protein